MDKATFTCNTWALNPGFPRVMQLAFQLSYKGRACSLWLHKLYVFLELFQIMSLSTVLVRCDSNKSVNDMVVSLFPKILYGHQLLKWYMGIVKNLNEKKNQEKYGPIWHHKHKLLHVCAESSTPICIKKW